MVHCAKGKAYFLWTIMHGMYTYEATLVGPQALCSIQAYFDGGFLHGKKTTKTTSFGSCVRCPAWRGLRVANTLYDLLKNGVILTILVVLNILLSLRNFRKIQENMDIFRRNKKMSEKKL